MTIIKVSNVFGVLTILYSILCLQYDRHSKNTWNVFSSTHSFNLQVSCATDSLRVKESSIKTMF